MEGKICWVCFPQRDGTEPLQGELAAARRRFLADPKHTVSIDRDQNVKGFNGHLRGKIGKRHFYWKKKVSGTSGGEVIVEEAFGRRDGWVLVVRDMYGVIVSRTYFSKQHDWLRTEYYEPWDSTRARVAFSAGSEPGAILRRDWDPETQHYHDVQLCQIPYRPGTAEQSVVDAQFGTPQLLLSMADGEACCCPKAEADARQEAIKNVSSGTVVLMPAWEIKGGEIIKDEGGDADITFTSLEEYAKIEPAEPGKPVPALTGETLPAPESRAPAHFAAQSPSPSRSGFEYSAIEPHPAQRPEPERPLPPMGEEFAPGQLDPVPELPVTPLPAEPLPAEQPHEARHMRGSVSFEELIDGPVEPAFQAPPVQPAPPPGPPLPAPEPPAPVETASLQTAPVQTFPVPAAPVQTAPVQTAPVQTAPVQTSPIMPAPVQTEPVQTTPTQTAPIETAPPEPAPAAAAPAESRAQDDDADFENILAEATLYAKAPALPEPSQETAEGMSIPDGYTGDITNGKISGRGRTEQRSGLTSYDGDYVNGKRHGFGAYYYKDGNLCYAGTWRNDRRDGLGVSFRDSDHALHVANWKNGQPDGLVTLFDSQGNLRYSGRMENGKKEGAGVVINGEDGTVFVGQWSGGEATGLGSAFDRDGRLLYYGSWKDGKRHGHGTEFDLNGGVVFDGEFRDGKYFNGVLYQKL